MVLIPVIFDLSHVSQVKMVKWLIMAGISITSIIQKDTSKNRYIVLILQISTGPVIDTNWCSPHTRGNPCTFLTLSGILIVLPSTSAKTPKTPNTVWIIYRSLCFIY